ncbi:Di-copper centre-containing protein [Fomitiporia mediterranea MF3/22]|uniref:Di-copper centre-containing protein n=1 Tax=Fomitiporia mediterranea (strain MF3/22) TaxID=694068 RepID=UPI0004408FC2|nr:Di-copper centre-containing protein [Fomitiporia mediterranea MF3/22]EJD00118.1 Di-copper centre-containing protein [Fomitiporia mediterranea MF3/22]
MDLNTRIHVTGYFLPWHRWYVAVYEQALKESCRYTDSADVFDSDFFKGSGPASGIGGWSEPSKDFSVTGGVFSDSMIAYPNSHILRRIFSLQPWKDLNGFNRYPLEYANATFMPDAMRALVDGHVEDFVGFQADFEKTQGAHGTSFLLFGDLRKDRNELLFWMHHAMVDKVWSDWKNANSENFWAFFGGTVQGTKNVTYYDQYPNGAPPFLSLNDTMLADGMFNETTIYNVMNTTGGFMCYMYE